MGMERISVGGGGWDDDGGGGDEQCATQPAPPSSFSLMTGEDNIKLVTAPWRRRWWGGCAERRRAVRAACVAATVLLAVVVLSNYASWGGDHDEMPASLFTTRGSEDATPANFTDDQLLGGLLTAAFSPQSCRSRYEFAGYHKRKLAHKPSSYLIAKLRKHEALQKRCGPGTAPYKKALRQLKSGDGAAADDDDCCYVISVGYDRGLGNRILAIASAFLYAVLTERPLLVAPYYGDVAALFCEPFPGTTWLLPDGRRFPLQHLRDFDGKSKESLGNLLKSNAVSVAGGNGTSSWSGRPPPYVYLHVEGGADFYDKLFYCDEQQSLLRGVPWLLMKTDCYLVPGLFLVPSLRGELDRMFPEKDAVFHHLSRYLLHPANAVWHAITAYHREHLAGAGRLVGIQIRVYQKETPPVSQVVLDQALSCARREKLLPFPTAGTTNTSSDQTVLVTSLNSWYSDMIRDELAGAVGGGVHQPSHEGWQRLGNTAHDMRALSEMYLLSTCDVLLTSGFSTFGYVAQGLAGERPWLMPRRPVWDKEPATEVPEPPCARAASPEPCFHSPSYYDCAARRNYDDIDKAVPYIRRCEDVSWGIQLVNGSSQSKW